MMNITQKKCKLCNEVKPLSEYPNRTVSKDGTRNQCKVCYLNKKMEYNQIHSQHRREYMVKYRMDNPTYNSDWIRNNYDRYRKYLKQWKVLNPDKVRIHKLNTYKRRLKWDVNFKIKENIRRLINLSFTNRGYSKNQKTATILGCSYDEFIAHIQRNFQTGMNWENRGEWELDHIIPISSAQSEGEIILLNHYTNFQPLWRDDNLRKGNHYNEWDKVRFLEKVISHRV
jgi:hypothetical protein